MQTDHITETLLDTNGPMFPPGTVRHWYQDGGIFHLFESRLDAAGTINGHPPQHEVCEVTYPHPVKDWDLKAAIAARVWFLTEWCKANNVTPYQAA